MPDTPARTYPREWFNVDRFSRTPEPRTFIRETEKNLFFTDNFGRERREQKTTTFSTWYPTIEEAQAQVDLYVNHEAARVRRLILSGKAEDLLAALVEVLDGVGAMTNPSEFPNILGIPTERGEEILALIKECNDA